MATSNRKGKQGGASQGGNHGGSQGSSQGANQGNNQGNAQGGSPAGKAGNEQSTGKKRGFASMDPALQREIAAEGGRAAHEKGTAHEFTSEEARRAGSMSHKNDQNRQSARRDTGEE